MLFYNEGLVFEFLHYLQMCMLICVSDCSPDTILPSLCSQLPVLFFECYALGWLPTDGSGIADSWGLRLMLLH